MLSKINDKLFSSTTNQQHNENQETKVPIFVLHPSGTHYIPMCIDASAVSHTFKTNDDKSHPSSTTNQIHCHPISIPVNFNPTTVLSGSYELEIQNINVIASRHQTSVKPN